MADIRPFHGIKYVVRPTLSIANVIAPPYDVLDDAGKSRLQSRDPHNIVSVDLPFMPPKAVGPDAVYDKANLTLQSWLSSGILRKDTRPATYLYTQSFSHHDRTFHRRGFIVLVRLSEFGGGDVVPHEQTYRGPIEDRLKLMHATRMQLSPIFGLFSDPRGEVTRTLYEHVGRAELDGTLDDVRHQLWSVIDAEVETRVIDAMKDKPIYIADGHHRYTTALQYRRDLEAKLGPLPPAHPANFCMFVLVSMQNDGLLILPTHRLIGGIESFDAGKFRSAMSGVFDVVDIDVPPDGVAQFVDGPLAKAPPHTFGLYDGRTKKLFQLSCRNPDVLKSFEQSKSDAWRKLDVAILQRYLIEEILQPKFGGGKELPRGYTADSKQIVSQTDGKTFQIALLLKSTPLHALEELGKTGEVMPQKSTFFYPKLATGMAIYPLE